MSMGIYIKGMEMPKDRPQLLWVYPNGKALIVQSDVDPWKDLRAVPVPPHGRLIDADALEDNNITYYAIPVLANANDAAIRKTELVIRIKDIDAAPTIIPAEEGEAK